MDLRGLGCYLNKKWPFLIIPLKKGEKRSRTDIYVRVEQFKGHQFVVLRKTGRIRRFSKVSDIGDLARLYQLQ
jgi:hypothetical protein